MGQREHAPTRQCFLDRVTSILDGFLSRVVIGNGFSNNDSTCVTQLIIVLDSEDRPFVFQEFAIIVCAKTPSLTLSFGFTATWFRHGNMGDIKLETVIRLELFV